MFDYTMQRGRREIPQAPSDLLERDGELEAVEAALASAASGSGRLVVIRGLPGLGKTALMGAAMAMARDREMSVLAATASELEQEFAFGVAVQLFGRALESLPTDRHEEAVSGAAHLAARVVESSDAEPGDHSIQSLLHGFHWLTSNLASEAPLALFVDDAHWADAPSLHFVAYLLQRLEDLPAALFVALRPHEAAALSESIALLHRHSGTTVLDLHPLSSASVRTWLRSDLGEQASDDLCAAGASATGGNPFLVRELSMELDREIQVGSLPAPDHVSAMAPGGVLWSVLARLGSLPEEATSLVQALAILGNQTPLRRAAQLAEVDFDVAANLADALVGVDILQRGEPLAFSHALVQSAIATDISPLKRGQAHLKAASILHREGAPAPQVAAQLLRSPPGSEAWVAETLCAAARQAADRGDPEGALRYFARALEEALDRPSRSAVLIDLAEVEAALGRATALERLEQALELAADGPARARIYSLLGRALYTAARYREAGEAFSRGLEEIDPSADGEIEQLLRAGRLAVAAIRAPGTAEFADAVEPLRQSDRPALPEERSLVAHLALTLAVRGEPADQVRDLALRALANGALLEDETSDSLTFNVLVGALFIVDATDVSAGALEAAIEDARRRGSAMAFATCSYSRGWVYYYAGRLKEAAADLEFATEARHYGWARFMGIAAQRLAHVRMDLGELDAAAAALSIPDSSFWDTAQGPMLLEARGRLRLLQGDPEAARDDLLTAGERMSEMDMRSPGLSSWRSNAALATSRLGDEQGARRLAAEELDLARHAGAPRAVGIALRTAGLIDAEDGTTSLKESAAELERSPSRLEYARTIVELGAALRRAGKRRAARQPLTRGLELAEKFAAAPIAARAREELLATGARQPDRPGSGIESLTASELRVAKMAATGMTNREIAQELFVTRKAVEFHLGNVYSKLEIKSRRALPEALTESA